MLATNSWNQFANILPISFEVTITSTYGGHVTMNDTLAVSDGTESRWMEREKAVTFDIEADEGYYLASVTMNEENATGQLVDERLTIESLEDDVSVNAVFRPLTECDLNDDGELTEDDVAALVTLILSGENNLQGDLNSDGRATLADVTLLVNLILKP